jgi:hypothetical protein
VPVRIIFRGLILFRFPVAPDPDAGKLVAQLINKPIVPTRAGKRTRDKPPRGPHEHNHGAQIQIATDHGVKDERLPVDLVDKERIDITVLDNKGNAVVGGAVTPEKSFHDHVPKLSDVMANASIQAVREAARIPLQPNPGLVRNTITIDRGIIRVREIVTWDHGAFPLNGRRGQPPGSPDDRGRQPASHVGLKFVGSKVHGHMASEFVVDIFDTNRVALTSNKNSRLRRKAGAKGNPNHRVPYDTVEILITNYEMQEHTAVPWGLDFQWLFETAGYASADLAADFADFEAFATTFDRAVFDHDREMLLDVAPVTGRRTIGRPFPYIAESVGVTRLTRLSDAPLATTDEEDRPICIGAFD